MIWKVPAPGSQPRNGTHLIVTYSHACIGYALKPTPRTGIPCGNPPRSVALHGRGSALRRKSSPCSAALRDETYVGRGAYISSGSG